MKIKAILKRVFQLSLIPLVVSGIGVLCNVVVMEANNGMPVKGNNGAMATVQAYEIAGIPYPEHISYYNDTKLKFLADIFPFNDRMYSVGDFLMYIGFALWFIMIGVAIYQYLKDRQLAISVCPTKD